MDGTSFPLDGSRIEEEDQGVLTERRKECWAAEK